MNKQIEIFKVSNPTQVQRLANKYLGENYPVYLSTHKNKKYMIFHNRKFVHFGSILYQDYTKHKDKKRLQQFRQRNYKWSQAEKYSPSWLSWYLLWNK